MTPKQNKTLHRAIKTFGEQNQKMQTIEELQELQTAIFENVHRGTDNKDEIAKEVADVEIMLAQVKIIYGLDSKQIEDVKDYKIERLGRTIEKYTNQNVQTKDSTQKTTIQRNISTERE